VAWTFGAGQTISSLWDGNWTPNGANVAVTNMGYNGSIAPNATRTFGFLGTWNNSTNPIPALTCTAT
jgi:cellulase/cellobiase CelA1